MKRKYRFSTPEILALLSSNKLKRMMGLAINPYENLSESEVSKLLAKGFYRFLCLRNYGYSEDSTNPRADEVELIENMVTISGLPTNSLLISTASIQGSTEWSVWHQNKYFSKSFFVQYSQMKCGFHLFEPITGMKEFAQKIWACFPHGLSVHSGETVSLSKEGYWQKRQDLGDKHRALKDALLESGTQIVLSSIKYDENPVEKLSILYTKEYLWLISENTENITFLPLSESLLVHEFTSFMKGFLAS